jgi:hypothetical protein
LKRKSKVGELTFPKFPTYCRGEVIKTVRFFHQDIHRSRKRIQAINKLMTVVSCSSTRAPRLPNMKIIVFSVNEARITGYPYSKS